ncbi:conjugal transfer mating pair stabilization protein TraG [Escherichia coli]|uniref:Conjugal transfer mating pair stabilization protein TraG n=1 Tax=Escherichia coli TaxID=562 RepID=A0AAX2KK12_ECOLX|nr:conjugal transfer mating pair stabilization protein TraG [Escherichia coli]
MVDGNYSYGNMQTENVNGFSWSTNSTTSFGQMMYQTGSGATATQTRDGNMVMDASGAMSRLPVGINATRQIAAAQQKWPGRRRTEQKVPCMVSAAVLPVPGTRSVSLVLTGGAVILSQVVLTAR